MEHRRGPDKIKTRTGYVAVGGHNLEFVSIPAQRAGLPALVFLHEGLGSVALWRTFPAALAKRTGCGAIVFSRYGNGFSTSLSGARTPAYMHDEALIALPALLDRLEVAGAVLVGHSDGASIALLHAAVHPENVRALVLEAPHVFVEDLSVRSIARVKTEYESTGLRARMARYHADVDRTFYGWNDIWLSPPFRDWNIEALVERVRAPIFVVQGLDDAYGTPAQIESIGRRAAGPVDRLLLAGCGHTPHRDRGSLVESAAGAWLQEKLL
ncbi:MAG: alpha/beta hydrolase [Candidatus Tumulicola sp.]